MITEPHEAALSRPKNRLRASCWRGVACAAGNGEEELRPAERTRLALLVPRASRVTQVTETGLRRELRARPGVGRRLAGVSAEARRGAGLLGGKKILAAAISASWSR